eukprot:m.75623 g.75623  ORF g.75623 m.75623 type:complete len:277 (-) comp18975_c0_seq1:170-1000(-)
MPIPSGAVGVLGAGGRRASERATRPEKQRAPLMAADVGIQRRASAENIMRSNPVVSEGADCGQPELESPVSDAAVLNSFGVTFFRPADAEESQADLSSDDKSDEEAHETMLKILKARLVKVRATKALFTRNPDLVVSHLIKVADDTLSVDVVPVLMQHLEDQIDEATSTASPENLSIAACFELLQVLRSLIDAAFEDYQIVAIDAVDSISTHWDSHLRALAREMDGPAAVLGQHSISAQGMYVQLVGMQSRIEELCTADGPVGKAATRVTGKLKYL